MSENKTGKPAWPAGRYFKYAIGEIVLVVIGILIALQINNWNEETKNRIKKVTFQNALVEDLKKDTSELKDYLNIIEIRIKGSDEFIQRMEKSDATTDSIIHLWISGWYYYNPFPLNPNKSSFESLYSAGNIELFSDEQITMLGIYYEDMEVKYSSIQFMMNEINKANKELGNKFGYLWKQNRNSHIYKILRRNVDEIEFLRLLDLAIYKENQNIQRIRHTALEILIETDSLLNTLNRQIE